MHDYSISMTFSTRLQLNIFWFAAIRPTIQKSIKYSLWQRQHKMHNFWLKAKAKKGRQAYHNASWKKTLLQGRISGLLTGGNNVWRINAIKNY